MGDMKDPGDEGPVPLFRPGLPVERRSGILPGVKLAKPKIAVAIGAMLIAAVLVLPRSRPAVELRFVRYTNVGTVTCAVLGLTNHGASRLLVMNTAGLDTLFCSLSEKSPTPTLDCWLPQRSGTQFVAWPRPRVDFPDPMLPPPISLRYWPVGVVHDLMLLASREPDTGRVVSVVLPPR